MVLPIKPLKRLWFDVGNGRYTTLYSSKTDITWLWFDVGNGRYTTIGFYNINPYRLWFDVGNGRYTTISARHHNFVGCGLM